MMQRTITRGARALFRMLVFTACAVSVCLPALHAQPPDTITANPKAVALRQVWVAYGQHSNENLGSGIGGIPDINGDSIDEFAVYSAGEWRIYYGQPEPLSTTPTVVMKGYGVITHPIVGDFWGTGHKAIGLVRGFFDTVDDRTFINASVEVFRTDSDRIDTVAAVSFDPRTATPRTIVNIADAEGADLDDDGADELVILMTGVRRGDSLYSSELWIYKGGPDFSLDSPTIIVRVYGSSQSLYIGRWDNDAYPDIAVATNDASRQLLKFWFGAPGSPWNWTAPEKFVETPGVPGYALVALDCDGDSVLDLAMPRSVQNRVRLYLSGAGKSVRTRAFDSVDADRTYYRKDYSVPVNFGYLSDSARHYEILGVGGAEGFTSTMLLFNGGPNGPDHSYDAYYQGEVFGLTSPIGDVTGDGWNDAIEGYGSRGFNEGIAVIWAGGPYIPRDSLTIGVVDVAVAGRRDAISIWPNPAVADLHIAWRGDLHRMPARFSVHDLMGREVAIGSVEPWRGEALWHCADRPAGVYLVSVYDERGDLLVTTSIIKQ